MSVGLGRGIREDLGPGKIVVPHQIIDYTWGRANTFFDERGAGEAHRLHRALHPELRARLLARGEESGEAAVDGAVYAATQGRGSRPPRRSIASENDGADIVGMTGMPEASLAREIELAYAADRGGGQPRRRPRRRAPAAYSCSGSRRYSRTHMGRVRRIIEALGGGMIREVLRMGDPRLLERSQPVEAFGTPRAARADRRHARHHGAPERRRTRRAADRRAAARGDLRGQAQPALPGRRGSPRHRCSSIR